VFLSIAIAKDAGYGAPTADGNDAANIAKLPELLRRKDRPQNDCVGDTRSRPACRGSRRAGARELKLFSQIVSEIRKIHLRVFPDRRDVASYRGPVSNK
jgi:hypothetical protein